MWRRRRQFLRTNRRIPARCYRRPAATPAQRGIQRHPQREQLRARFVLKANGSGQAYARSTSSPGAVPRAADPSVPSRPAQCTDTALQSGLHRRSGRSDPGPGGPGAPSGVAMSRSTSSSCSYVANVGTDSRARNCERRRGRRSRSRSTARARRSRRSLSARDMRSVQRFGLSDDLRELHARPSLRAPRGTEVTRLRLRQGGRTATLR